MEYLGHIITPNGLWSNPKLVSAVKDYPTPQSVQDVRLGLATYYRRFIPQFAKVAQPLHQLTGRGAISFIRPYLINFMFLGLMGDSDRVSRSAKYESY